MDAVVLVGGFGTRLQPLTLTRPKQMLPVVDRPMIEHVVQRLGDQGVQRAVLSLGYQPDVFRSAYPQGSCAGVELHYATEPEPLDTAGAIAFAARSAGVDDTFLAVNGDVLGDFRFAELLDLHQRRGAEATIHLIPVDDPSRYGVVPTDADGRVLDFVEKPPADAVPSRWINAGTYLLEPSVLDLVGEGERVSIEHSTFPALARRGSLYAVERDGFWVDAGTPESYIGAQLHLSRGGHIHPAARLASDARVERSIVMQGASVGSGAQVTGSVLLPGCNVQADAVVADSIVGYQAVIGTGARLAEMTVIGDNQNVQPGAMLLAARLPD